MLIFSSQESNNELGWCSRLSHPLHTRKAACSNHAPSTRSFFPPAFLFGDRHDRGAQVRRFYTPRSLTHDLSLSSTTSLFGYCIIFYFSGQGRSWYTAHRGRLWIAATVRAPVPSEVEAVESQYSEIYEGNVKRRRFINMCTASSRLISFVLFGR